MEMANQFDFKLIWHWKVTYKGKIDNNVKLHLINTIRLKSISGIYLLSTERKKSQIFQSQRG